MVRQIFRLINYFILLRSVHGGITTAIVKEFAIDIVQKDIKKGTDDYKIITKIYPDIFNIYVHPRISGFLAVFRQNKIDLEEIDLSNCGIEGIPLRWAKKMINITKLDLSSNKKLNLNGEWLKEISKNLKELIIKDCELQEKDLEAISGLEELEKLTISSNKCFNTSSPHFNTILKRLKYLDISKCDLNATALEQIYTYAEKLEYLDLSSNTVSNFISKRMIETPIFKDTIKVLKMVYCGIGAKELKDILCYSQLEEIDLSNNNFEKITVDLVDQLFVFEGQSAIDSQISIASNLSEQLAFTESTMKSTCQAQVQLCPSKLKIICLKSCNIVSKEFISKLFDLENLNTLKLSYNKAKLDFKEILNKPASQTLKILEMKCCFSFNSDQLKSLTSFPTLEKLDISSNAICDNEDGFELGCSKDSLIELNVSNSQLKLSGLKAFTNYSKLKKLNISSNNFSDIEEGFELGCSKDSLIALDLSFSELTSIGLKVFTDCPKLEKLKIVGNNFSGIGNEFKLGCSKDSFIELDISFSELTPIGLKVFTNCSKLKKLNVSDNNFSGITEEFKLGCSKDSLVELDISFSELTPIGLKVFIDCPKLEILNISGNNLSNIEDKFMIGYSRYSLTEVNASSTHLNHSSLKIFTNCPKLEKLNINDNNFFEVNEGFELGCLKYSLIELDISFAQLTSIGLKAFTNCTKLEKLNMNGNNFSGIDDKFELGCLKNSLIVLDASFSELTLIGLKIFTDCPKLEKLRARNNNFSDIANGFEFEFGCSKDSLKELDLSFSFLTLANIKSIANCSCLNSLNIRPILTPLNENEMQEIISHFAKTIQILKA